MMNRSPKKFFLGFFCYAYLLTMYYPIFILFFVICGICIINKALDHHLFIFYIAFASLIISFYKIIHVYVKK